MKKHVKIIAGPYTGRRAVVLEEGTLQVFDRQVVGLKVDAGLAGPLVLAPEAVVEIPAPAANAADDELTPFTF